MLSIRCSLNLAKQVAVGLLLAGCAATATMNAEPRSESERPPDGVEQLPAEGDSVQYDVEPTPLTQVPPAYPISAREAGIQGKVVLHVLVDATGKVRDIRVIEGVTELNEAAIDAVRQWTFRPALRNDEPVATWTSVPMYFHF
jgi:periplasmic protein TonB